jgi:hypothetical protein
LFGFWGGIGGKAEEIFERSKGNARREDKWKVMEEVIRKRGRKEGIFGSLEWGIQ